MDKKDFCYVKNTLKQYKKEENSKLDEFKALNKKVKYAPRIASVVLGVISSLVLGLGMSIALGVIYKDKFGLGLALGLIGIAMCIANVCIYEMKLNKNKEKYRTKITTLGNDLLEDKI